MQIQFLGTGAGMPSKLRNTSSVALKLLEERREIWLFDCGEATQHQILHTTIKPGKINKVFVTHLHGDHIFGLPGFLSSRSFLGGNEPLTIYGPAGLEDWLRMTLHITKTHLTYEIHFVTIEEGLIFEDEQCQIYASLLEHVIPCYGYRIVQKDLPGKLDVEKARALGVPNGPLLGRLKQGYDVQLENGRTILSQQVVSEPIKGCIVTILGDTRYCQAAVDLAKDADVLVHEATFDEQTAKLASIYGHATNEEAALVAKQAGVKQLFMNHISARFLPNDLQRLEQHAKSIFANSTIVQDFEQYDWRNRTFELL